MRSIGLVPLLLAATPGVAAPPSDAVAIARGRPQSTIVDKSLSPAAVSAILKAVDAFYGFWNNGDPKLLKEAVSPHFVDRALPPGRPQGPTGPLVAYRGFMEAVPDLRCAVEQRLVVGNRVISHLRFTGHFKGIYQGRRGVGQLVDFIATDDLRVSGGRITDNWHLEDNLAFMKQIGAVR